MEEKNVGSRVIRRFFQNFLCVSIWKQDVDGIDQNDSDLEKDPAPSANFRTKYWRNYILRWWLPWTSFSFLHEQLAKSMP